MLLRYLIPLAVVLALAAGWALTTPPLAAHHCDTLAPGANLLDCK